MSNNLFSQGCVPSLSVLFAATVVLPAAGAPVQWTQADGGNGHFYDVIIQTITWEDAKLAAESMTLGQVSGHLATVTSQAENNFLASSFSAITDGPFPNGPWLGGFQPPGSPEPDGNWQWVTGETFAFTNWDTDEPNNTYLGGPHGIIPWGTSEERLQFHGNPLWNDLPTTATTLGYVVEFAPEPTTLQLVLLGLAGIVGQRRK